MGQEDAGIGVGLQDAARHQRHRRHGSFERKYRRRIDPRNVADTLGTDRVKRMDHDRHIQPRGFGKEGREGRIAQRRAHHVGPDLDTGQAFAAQRRQLLHSALRRLQRHHAKAGEPIWMPRDKPCEKVVDRLAHRQRTVAIEPIGQKLGHGRQDLMGDTLCIHVSDPRFGVPRPPIQAAKHVATYHDLGRAVVIVMHGRPARIAPGAVGKMIGHDVGMDIDCPRWRGLGQRHSSFVVMGRRTSLFRQWRPPTRPIKLLSGPSVSFPGRRGWISHPTCTG